MSKENYEKHNHANFEKNYQITKNCSYWSWSYFSSNFIKFYQKIALTPTLLPKHLKSLPWQHPVKIFLFSHWTPLDHDLDLSYHF